MHKLEIDNMDDLKKNMVWVRWLDHHSGHNTWTIIDKAQSDIDEPYYCDTAGFLLGESDMTLQIANTINDGNGCLHVMYILKSTITDRLDFEI